MKPIITKTVLIFGILCTQRALAATDAPDSLFKALKKHVREDAARADILIAISQFYYTKDFKKSHEYAVKAEKLSEKIGYDKGYYRAITHKANAIVAFGKPADAVKIYKKILAYDKKTNDTVCMAVDYNLLSTAHAHMGKYEMALQYAFKSLRLCEQLNDVTNQILNLNLIAGNYYTLNKYTQAKKYIYQALDLLRTHPHATLQAYCYAFLAACYEVNDQMDSTTFYLNKARAIYEKIGDLPGLITAYNNLSELMLQQEQIDSATFYAQRATAYAKKMGWSAYIGNSYRKTAACYLYKAQHNSSNRTFNYTMSLAYLDSCQMYVSHATEDQSVIFQMRSEAHKAVGKYDSALVWYEKFKQVSDSVYYSQQNATIEELNVRYQVEKKEQQNKALQQKNTIQQLELERGRYLLYGLIALALLVVLISVLFIRQNRIKSNQRMLRAEQKLLRSQMNPHFIFNSLASIESFIYSNHPKDAGKYLSDFARLMRLILENSREEEITLENEIKTLKYYLSMQQLRMEDRLSFSIEVDENLDQLTTMVPPMLTQPFIENAIEHGIPPDQKGMVRILYRKQHDALVIEVIDDGVGILHSLEHKLASSGHKSVAMEITRERLELLNKGNRKKARLIVTDRKRENKSGTHISILLPS